MDRYKLITDGLYKNIYTIRDIHTGMEWSILDLDLEETSDLPMSNIQCMESLCNLLNKKEREVQGLEELLEVFL